MWKIARKKFYFENRSIYLLLFLLVKWLIICYQQGFYK
jgi:hypothetical protein